jgi:hypothetical protein
MCEPTVPYLVATVGAQCEASQARLAPVRLNWCRARDQARRRCRSPRRFPLDRGTISLELRVALARIDGTCASALPNGGGGRDAISAGWLARSRKEGAIANQSGRPRASSTMSAEGEIKIGDPDRGCGLLCRDHARGFGPMRGVWITSATAGTLDPAHAMVVQRQAPARSRGTTSSASDQYGTIR